MEARVSRSDTIHKGAVHMILCGGNKDHITTIIERTSPVHIELFTSKEMLYDTQMYVRDLDHGDIDINIETIPAFDETSIVVGSETILKRYRELRKRYSDKEIFLGLTGGTNLMVAAMTIVAIATGCRVHYISKDTNNDERFDRILNVGRINTESCMDLLQMKDKDVVDLD